MRFNTIAYYESLRHRGVIYGEISSSSFIFLLFPGSSPTQSTEFINQVNKHHNQSPLSSVDKVAPGDRGSAPVGRITPRNEKLVA